MDKNLLDSCENCLHEEPAASTAWCPIHVDVVSFIGEMEKGDFKKAYKVLEKRMPFAGIIGMICDHPCEKACVRDKLDRSICISELERAAVFYGRAPLKKSVSAPKNNGKVAVVGGGISGISAAYELDKKGFTVTIYEASERLGGHIWSFEGKQIEKEKIEEELKLISDLGIRVNFNHRVGQDELNRICAAYDAVFLATGTWESQLAIDPNTFRASDSPLFAGGGLCDNNDSVIFAVSFGKRAAISIERYVKRISLTAAREREGSFVTPLNYNLEDVKPTPRVEKTHEIYTEEEAVNEAKRCLKCKCVECVKACSHLQKFNVTPKSYARQIQINENVIMGTRYANKMINSCTMCGLCEQQCPVGIGMQEIIHQTRESMVEKGKMPISAHDFALKDLEFSNSGQFFMVKPSEKEKTDYLFYPGCQLSASYPEYVEKSYKYLVSEMQEGVGLMLGCCGAPADWAGRQDVMEQSIECFKTVWTQLSKPTFILACSSCCGIFEKHLPEINYISLWEVFEKHGLPQTANSGQGLTLNIHDACATRHNTAIQESLRSLAKKLGYEIRELKYSKEKTKCCGYGGLVYYANKEQAQDFVRDRMNESDDNLLVYCAMCKDLFVEGGKRSYHILDLIFGEDLEELSHQKMPNLSERHANRALLKRKLLKEFWNEECDNAPITKPDLTITDEVWRKMEERYILLEEVEKVIENAQKTGERFYNPQDNTYLASLRLGSVTFWVRYREHEGDIQVISVYSHRMELVKD